MSDVVVTVPKGLWTIWTHEGDLAYPDTSLAPAEWEGDAEYGFTFGPGMAIPKIEWGERVYVVSHGRLRGYAPLTKISMAPERFGGRPGGFALVRRGEGVACTIPEPIRGFQGWRYRHWNREDEIPFPDWQTAGVT